MSRTETAFHRGSSKQGYIFMMNKWLNLNTNYETIWLNSVRIRICSAVLHVPAYMYMLRLQLCEGVLYSVTHTHIYIYIYVCMYPPLQHPRLCACACIYTYIGC